MARLSPARPTGTKRTSLGSDGRPSGSPPSETMAMRGSANPWAEPAARAKAAGQSAAAFSGVAAASARRNAGRSAEAAANTCGVRPTRMSVSRSSPLNPPMSWSTAARASSKRVPAAPSAACMEAEASSRTMVLPPPRPGSGSAGRASARTSAARMSSCSSSSRLRRRRCHGALAARSRTNSRHSHVLLTGCSRRRRRSM